MLSHLENTVWELVSPVAEELGLRVVRVRHSGAGEGQSVLQIMLENKATGPDEIVPVTVDECREVSKAAAALLDVEDVIPGAYRLEVSSPGLERPLVTRDDFARYAGRTIKVELHEAMDNRRKFKGELGGLKNDEVQLKLDDKEDVMFPYGDIKNAKLVFTDADMKKLMSKGR